MPDVSHERSETTRRRTSRLALAYLLLAFALWTIPTASSAAPGWLSPETLEEESEPVPYGPFAAMDAEGEALTVWDGLSGRNETSRPPGGPWQEPGSILSTGERIGRPCLGESPPGEAVVLGYRGSEEGGLDVQVFSKPPGSPWQDPVDVGVGEPDEIRVIACDVAVNSAGAAVAVWAAETEFNFEAVWAAYRPADGTWEPAVQLEFPPAYIAVEPKAAISPAGEALVVWRGGLIKAAAKPPGGSWEESTTLSEEGHFAALADVAFDGSGDAVAAWQLDRSFEENIVQAAYRPAGGSWGEPEDLSEGENATSAQVGMDAQGEALVVWETSEEEHHIIQGAERSVGGTWQSPVDLSASGEFASYPSLAMNPEGDAIAVWEAHDGKTWSVQGAARPTGGPWVPAAQISAGAASGEFFPQVGIDGEGDGVAAWVLQESGGNLVQAAGYDAVAPNLSALDIPSSGVAGSPIGMSVLASDVWSPAPQIRWSFGDGSSASGPVASHVYSGTGAYLVTVEGEDMVGNVTTLQRKISIAPPPPHEVPSTPSNRFSVVRAKVRQNGRIALLLRVPGSGTARAKARAKRPDSGLTFHYRPSMTSAPAAGNVRLILTLPHRAAVAAKSARRLRVHITISFTPQGGISNVKHLSFSSCLGSCSGMRGHAG